MEVLKSYTGLYLLQFICISPNSITNSVCLSCERWLNLSSFLWKSNLILIFAGINFLNVVISLCKLIQKYTQSLSAKFFCLFTNSVFNDSDLGQPPADTYFDFHLVFSLEFPYSSSMLKLWLSKVHYSLGVL